jgi:hypothetical protein
LLGDVVGVVGVEAADLVVGKGLVPGGPNRLGPGAVVTGQGRKSKCEAQERVAEPAGTGVEVVLPVAVVDVCGGDRGRPCGAGCCGDRRGLSEPGGAQRFEVCDEALGQAGPGEQVERLGLTTGPTTKTVLEIAQPIGPVSDDPQAGAALNRPGDRPAMVPGGQVADSLPHLRLALRWRELDAGRPAQMPGQHHLPAGLGTDSSI